MPRDDVTQWLVELARGDELAAQRIWQKYCQHLVRLASRRLGVARRRVADEEDVALSAFDSFCRGVAVGRFPKLDDRRDLWKVLVTLTARKAVDQLRRTHALKRGGGLVRGESVFASPGDTDGEVGIGAVVGQEPTPEFAAMVREQCESLFQRLDGESLRGIALLKLEGYGNEEIADRLGCGLRTVERKLSRIRQCWEREGHDAK